MAEHLSTLFKPTRDNKRKVCALCTYFQYINAAAAAAKSRQSCPTLCDPIDGSPPGSRPWDSPGNNTGVGCHFLIQCMKVKNESEVAQLSPTLGDPMDCSLPGSSIHGISQARVLEWGAIAFSVTNLDSTLKSRDITLPTKVRLVKAMVFPVVMYGCESWTIKKAEHRRIDAFELWCWRRLLRVP